MSSHHKPAARTPEAAPQKKSWISRLGPGLITGASDDDPSGIGTYAQVGAQFGFGMLWSMLFSYPLMVSVQLVSARIGRVTGRGIAANLRAGYPMQLLAPLILLLLVANTINIGADLGAMGASLHLLVGGSALWGAVGFGLVSMLLQIFVPYSSYVSILKWLTLAVFAYVAIPFAIDVPWREVVLETIVPHLSFTPEYLTAFVAVIGTTISPYLFFWQASQEVEDLRAAPAELPLKRARRQAPRQLARIDADTYVGMGVSNVVALFIILTAAVTLHQHGVTDIDTAAQAAEALRPIGGRYAFVLFATGIVGTGLLAIPVLAGSAAYAVGDVMGWRTGLEYKPREAKAFYAVVSASTLLGIAMNFLHLNAVKTLFWSAVINGVIAVPLLVVILLLASRRKTMGEFVLSQPLAALGWLTAGIMGLSAIAMLALWAAR